MSHGSKATVTMMISTLALALALLPGCKGEPDAEVTPADKAEPDEPKPADAEPEAKPEAASDAFPDGPYEDRDPALAKQLVEGGALLLDVRTPEEFESGHVEGAVNIDHSEVAARMEEIRELQGGDAHKPVVVYCKSGHRAGLAKDQLTEAGFDRVTNLGGFKDWPE